MPSKINTVYSENDQGRCFPHFVYCGVPRQAPPNCIRLNKAIVDSESYRVVITASIHVNRMAGQLVGESVPVGGICGWVDPLEFLPGPQYMCIKLCLDLFVP